MKRTIIISGSAAAAYAAAASASAAAAAASAIAAANAVVGNYLGGVAGASVPATATAAGDYYRVTSAGTSQGKTWSIGDFAIYEGTSGNWTQISGTGNVTGPVSSTDNAVARFDSTTGKVVQNSGVIIDDSNNVIASDYLLGASGPSMKSSIVARAPLQGLVFAGTAGCTASIGPLGSSDFTVDLLVLPNQIGADMALVGSDALGSGFYLWITSTGTLRAGGTGIGSIYSTGVVTAGKWQRVTYVRASGVGTFYINGVAVGSGTDTRTYSTASTTLGTYGGGTFFSGSLVPPVTYNRALSAAEVLLLYETGTPDARDYNNASNSTTVAAGAFVVGKKYRIASAGTTDFTLIGAANSSVGTEFVATGVGSGSGTAYPLGFLLATEPNAPGNGYQWKDMSGNKADITLPVSGVLWALPDCRPNSLRATLTWSASSAAQYLQTINHMLPTGAVVRDITVKGTASTSGTGFRMSTFNTGGYWVASVALTANTKKVCTVANRLPGAVLADANIYATPDSVNYTGSISIEVNYDITAGS